MKISEILKKLDLHVISGQNLLDRNVRGGYVSDMLSDVIANASEGDIWITLQTHLNIVPVASMKQIAGIIIVNSRKPDDETISKAEEENIPILGTTLDAFPIVGMLYQLGISQRHENI